jgi:hypothetical protein
LLADYGIPPAKNRDIKKPRFLKNSPMACILLDRNLEHRQQAPFCAERIEPQPVANKTPAHALISKIARVI